MSACEKCWDEAFFRSRLTGRLPEDIYPELLTENEQAHTTTEKEPPMSTPDFMPILSKGAHDEGSGQACVMEMVSFLAGVEWSDSPSCTHPVLARMAQVVNDRLPDAERQRLVPLIGRLFGTGETGTEHERKVLSVRLACWCARQVLDLAPDRSAALAAIEAAEGWVGGTVSEEECRTAYAAANAANAAYAAHATTAAHAAPAAAYANVTAAYAAAAYFAYDAAAYAANAAFATAATNLIDLLTGVLDEYDRLTGRTNHREVTSDDLARLAALTH